LHEGGLRGIQNAVSGFPPAGLRRATSSVSAGKEKNNSSFKYEPKANSSAKQCKQKRERLKGKLGQQWEVTK